MTRLKTCDFVEGEVDEQKYLSGINSQYEYYVSCVMCILLADDFVKMAYGNLISIQMLNNSLMLKGGFEFMDTDILKIQQSEEEIMPIQIEPLLPPQLLGENQGEKDVKFEDLEVSQSETNCDYENPSNLGTCGVESQAFKVNLEYLDISKSI
ncbi:hypothetical protein Ddye_010102 [Dipteronia dyeriana]|uniref:Uncharacterized protein n=1 Tax=Dipteronia dyeriana TaxID=168575 RepID=A0AAD9XCW5_9ROSI|nr:hypothetical protein Ddye_010102 [Dipteronia dyeriana]